MTICKKEHLYKAIPVFGVARDSANWAHLDGLWKVSFRKSSMICMVVLLTRDLLIANHQ